MKIEAVIMPSKNSKKEENLSLSVSKSKTFSDCKAKYDFSYNKKLPKIERDFHIFGKYLHKVLENFHRALLLDPSKKEDWKNEYKIAYDLAYDEYKLVLTDDQVKEAKIIANEYQSILEEEGLPNVTSVEKEFSILINGRVFLNGFIDRVQIDNDGIIHVADYKTTKDAKYLKDYFQLLTYAFVLMLEDKSLERVRTSFILLRRGYEYLTHEYTREEVMPVAEKFIKYADEIQAEKLWRPSPQFLCKYCDFLEHCFSGKKFLIKKGVTLDNNVGEKKFTIGITSWK